MISSEGFGKLIVVQAIIMFVVGGGSQSGFGKGVTTLQITFALSG